MALLFVLAIVGVFLLIFAAESEPGTRRGQLFNSGLLHWLITKNWTAKVGAGLLILGIGALLRYLLKEIDFPDVYKLAGGIAISACLALAAFSIKNRPDRRGVYFALAGSSAGVAYLSAYAAYGFFGYVQGFNALALLALVSAVTGIFAVHSKSLSIAILSMTGAYLAPAFHLGNATPLAVYGYYILISGLCLLMVSIRGWRGLIHLSFLFTLAGSVFFAWTSQFHQPQHYPTMQPALLILAAIHLAMPLLERPAKPSSWLERFDTAYFIALPSTCALLTWIIAPGDRQVSIGFALLAVIWGMAALARKRTNHPDFTRYGVISALFVFGSALFLLDDVSWPLFAMAACVALLLSAANLGFSKTHQELLAGILLFTGFLHVVDTLLSAGSVVAFINQAFLERTTAWLLLGLGALTCRKREIGIWRTLAAFSFAWLSLSMLAEALKLDIDYLPQLIHGLALILVFLASVISRRFKIPALAAMALATIFISCCWWASLDANPTYALFSAAASPAALMYMAVSRLDGNKGNDSAVIFVLLALPLSIAPWVYAASAQTFQQPGFISLAAAVTTVIFVWKTAPRYQPENPRTEGFLLPFHFFGVLAVLVFVDLFHIARNAPAVAFELLSAAYLVAFSFKPDSSGASRGNIFGISSVFAATLSVQAMILRLLGPRNAEILTIANLDDMGLPVIVSLTWAIFGAGLTWWSSKRRSRATWSLGTAILAVSALKMAVFDFGSLDQLGNIFALIAAGIVFLLVAWFAPYPPKPAEADGVGHRGDSGESLGPGDPTQEPAAERHPAAGEPSGTIREETRPASSLNKADAQTRRAEQPALVEGGMVKLLAIVFSVLILVSLIAIIKYQTDANRARPAPDSGNWPAAAAPGPDSGTADSAPDTATAAVQTTTAAPRPTDSCARFGSRLVLPPNFRVFAAGGYGGIPAGFQIDQSGQEATAMDVKVNHPENPVVLMLAAHEPTVWTISSSSRTEIVAVLLSGYHRQAFRGIADGIPVLISTHENQGVCGAFLISTAQPDTLNPLSRRVFGRDVDAVFTAGIGSILIGKELPDRNDYVMPDIRPKDAYMDPDAPLAGTQGILKSLRDGLIRRASDYDRQALAAAFSGQGQYTDGRVRQIAMRGDLFVVEKEFTYPAGLYGANSVTFMIPAGVPEPSGDPGHSLVYHMESGTCTTMNNMRCMR